jgi:hypothetical protein
MVNVAQNDPEGVQHTTLTDVSACHGPCLEVLERLLHEL